ncbi:hypothetical protein AB0C47_33075 [Micromonospora taraxaci]|uniref:hypothetical protein n=1 Tax=Micromonospora taraxaci TaxID=1316803 RepID=UPI0034016071
MRCPVSGTASTPAPRHILLLSPDQIRTLARRWALILAAVGAGFVVALLLQDPAAANGRHDGFGGERDQQAGVLVERVVRLGLGEAPEGRQQVTAVVEGRPDAPVRVSRVVSPADVRPPVASPRPGARSSRSAPLPRVDQDVVRGAARHGERLLRPSSETAVGARQRPAGTSGRVPIGVDAVRDPRLAVLPVVTSTVGLVADRSSHAVHAVLGPTVGPVVVVLGRVVDVALGEVVVPASPRLPASAPVPAPERPVSGCAPVAVSGAAGQAVSASLVQSMVVPVRVVPPPAAAEGFAGGLVSGAASAARGAGWSGLTPAVVGGPVWPVAPAGPVVPVDQDAVGAGDRSPPGSGSGFAVARPSPTCSERVFDVVPLVVAAGFPSVSARPG